MTPATAMPAGSRMTTATIMAMATMTIIITTTTTTMAMITIIPSWTRWPCASGRWNRF